MNGRVDCHGQIGHANENWFTEFRLLTKKSVLSTSVMQMTDYSGYVVY